MMSFDSTQTVPQPTMRHDATETCEVLLIRHGRSADVVPGSPEAVNPGLHEVGVHQAALLASRLADKRIDAVFSSHLARALATAAPLAAGRSLQVQVFEDLEEVRLGDWGNGEFRRRAASGDPEFIAWSKTGRWDGIPGAETDDQLRSRVSAVINELARRHRGQCIAVVAHGGAINAYVAALFGIHRTIAFAVENTSIAVAHVAPTSAMLGVVNDCSHLYDPVLQPPT